MAADDSRERHLSDKLGFLQFLRVLDEKNLIGIWSCFRESDITGDPRCKAEFKWRLSIPQAKNAFMDSQSPSCSCEIGRAHV